MKNAFWLVVSDEGSAVVRAPHISGAVASSGFSTRSKLECFELNLEDGQLPNVPGTSNHLRECVMRVVNDSNVRLHGSMK